MEEIQIISATDEKGGETRKGGQKSMRDGI